MRAFLPIILTATVLLGVRLGYAEDPFSVSATLEATGEGDALLSVAFAVKKPAYLYADKIGVEGAGVQLAPKAVPRPKEKRDPYLEETVTIYEHDVTLEYLVKGMAATSLAVTVRYQGCDDTLCYPPSTRRFTLVAGGKPQPVVGDEAAPAPAAVPDAVGNWRALADGFTVAGRYSGYMGKEKFMRFLDASMSGLQSESGLSERLAGKGALARIVLILIFGLGLNLTPCVLPMIPINIAIIGAGAQAGSRKRGLALGATYGGAMALAYGALGLVVVLTGTAFGALQSSPIFNFAVAAVFAFLALAMLGIVTIDFTRFQPGSSRSGSKGGRFAVAFGMGAVAALLAGACVAPIVIAVLFISSDLYAKGDWSGLLLPFLLGVGMALPWPFAGAGLSFLPKPGKWMGWVKQAFGAAIILFAFYYGHLGYQLLSGGKKAAEDGWYVSLPEALAAARKENKPVFMDFWANWCKSCVHMDVTTFTDPEVKAKLAGFVRVKYDAERPEDPAVKEAMRHFGAPGLPTYVVMKPK